MSCPRPGKECNEFMCSLSINGICYNKEIDKKSSNDMEWNVYFHDFNRNEIVTYNIFRHYRFNEEVQKLIKSKIDKTEFKERLRKELMYCFWSKCEYEIIISPWTGRADDIKIDIYDQIMMNSDKFVDYVWSFRKEE